MPVIEMLTAEEVSNRFFNGRMSTDKIYRLAKKRAMPSIRLDGAWFFTLEVINEWIKETSKVENDASVLKKYNHIKKIKE